MKLIHKVDAYAILTEWEEFKNLEIDYSKIFDGRNIMSKSYFSIGK